MHIEPGYVSPVKIAVANVGALGVFAWAAKEQIKELVTKPWMPVKTLLATVFFSIFMQSFHMPVGPSELHFVGAMAMYLTLGFTPVMLGFAIGLLFQGMVFNPGDLYHLGVNSLSLMLPLIAVHVLKGHEVLNGNEGFSWARVVKLDAMYYTGVTGMVGFWLMIGEVATPLSAWASFAVSYLAIVAIEPVITVAAVKLLKKGDGNVWLAHATAVKGLRIA